mmetsp:Transcript_370/g.803  ORF Transcript_370/g.803 Transcript_370/m.803 type:complete len:201 (-) Transcript_370:196-798(-)
MVAHKIVRHRRKRNCVALRRQPRSVILLEDPALTYMVPFEQSAQMQILLSVLLVVVVFREVQESMSRCNLASILVILNQLEGKVDQDGIQNGQELLLVNRFGVVDILPQSDIRPCILWSRRFDDEEKPDVVRKELFPNGVSYSTASAVLLHQVLANQSDVVLQRIIRSVSDRSCAVEPVGLHRLQRKLAKPLDKAVERRF